MRIISGKNKGRKIYPPKNFKARPTTDMAKESLFNILVNNYDFTKLSVLDLFSGSGSISYEFASRGCENITAVENDFNNAAFIKKISTNLNYSIKVTKADVFKFLKYNKNKFDIIFADPPYDMNNINTIPEIILSNGILNPNGCLILECNGKIDFSQIPEFKNYRKYGKVHFAFFENFLSK